MSDINKSFTSSNDQTKVITIQDTGLLIQLPGFFRGKPHFVSYDEIKHCTVTETEHGYKVNFFLKNNRNLDIDGLYEYEAESIKSAVLHGASGPLSSNLSYANELNDAKKKATKNTVIGVAVVIAFFLALWALSKITGW